MGGKEVPAYGTPQHAHDSLLFTKADDEVPYDEIEERMATDKAFIRRHRARSRLTRWLIIAVCAVGVLALYVRTRSSSTVWDADADGVDSGSASSNDDGSSDDGSSNSLPTTSEAVEAMLSAMELHVVDGQLPIHGVVSVTPTTAASLRITYACADESCPSLQTPWTVVEAGSTQQMHFHRLRTFTNYSVHVESRELGATRAEDSAISRVSRQVVTGSTGVPALDAHPFAAVSGSLGFEVYVTERAGSGLTGFVGIDAEGYVVWGLNISDTVYNSEIGDLPAHVISQYADHTFVVLTQGTLQLQRVDARGVRVGDAWSTPESLGCSALSHEAFLTGNASDSPVLTIQHEISEFERPLPDGNGTTTMTVLAQKLVRWDPGTNEMTTLFDVLDQLDPLTQTVWVDPFFPGLLTCTNDDGEFATYDVEDFTHCNSGAVSAYDGNLLFSSRAASTIFSISSDGDLEWTLTPNDPIIPSDFAFDNEKSKFYNQHFVRQLENGNILLMDNGNSRPSSHADGEYWSRAAEYSIDMDTGAVTLEWEFRPPNTYTSEGGSIDLLDNGRRLVHFPFIDTGSGFVSYVYEADADTAEVSGNLTIPWLGNNSATDTPTRGVAFKSIDGEKPTDGR